MKKSIILIIAFLFVGIGLLSLILQLNGLNFTFFRWVDDIGSPWNYFIKITMILIGFVTIVGSNDFGGKIDY